MKTQGSCQKTPIMMVPQMALNSTDDQVQTRSWKWHGREQAVGWGRHGDRPAHTVLYRLDLAMGSRWGTEQLAEYLQSCAEVRVIQSLSSNVRLLSCFTSGPHGWMSWVVFTSPAQHINSTKCLLLWHYYILTALLAAPYKKTSGEREIPGSWHTSEAPKLSWLLWKADRFCLSQVTTLTLKSAWAGSRTKMIYYASFSCMPDEFHCEQFRSLLLLSLAECNINEALFPFLALKKLDVRLQ